MHTIPSGESFANPWACGGAGDFCATAQGYIYYSVKRSGFENAALAAGADPFGFDGWRPLRLTESLPDPSVTSWESENLVNANSGQALLRSVYGDGDEVKRSGGGPVQLVSALGHLFVFRHAPSGKILLTRFVLDGMANELLPRLEVRYQRSRQRLQPLQSSGSQTFETTDNLDYRDLQGQFFYEPSVELSFLDAVAPGQFAVVLVPTSESDRHRFHLFVTDAAQLSDSLGIGLAVANCIGGVLPLSAFSRSRRVAPATAPPQKSTAPTPHDADDESQLDQDLQHD